MNINIIVAYCKNRGIGLNNNMPWKIKSDLKKFYKLTKGNGNNAVIMGKNTWNSLKCNPLKLRDNLIISSSLNFEKIHLNNETVKTFNSIENILLYCDNKKYDNIWIIGGEKIYSTFLTYNSNIINKIYVTELDNNYNCDTFFPEINNNFKCIQKKTHLLDKNYNEFNEMIIHDVWDKIYENINIHSMSK
tara:strand:- start:2224 stop:2793 length:570 start_codon:yes stop_codon:yes gene_type:complete